MAFDGTIPQLNNLISSDIPQIQENFSLLGAERIVEHNLDVASPANGYYVRWENGLQVCFYKNSVTITTTTSTGSLQRTDTNEYTWNFPASFNSDSYSISATRGNGGGEFITTTTISETASSVGFTFFVSGSFNSSASFSFVAIGRWQ